MGFKALSSWTVGVATLSCIVTVAVEQKLSCWSAVKCDPQTVRLFAGAIRGMATAAPRFAMPARGIIIASLR
jgi:hypothetical protein